MTVPPLARDRLADALRRELMGPSEPNEVIKEFPTTRYIVGRLAPALTAEGDTDAGIDPTENDSLGVGTDADEDGDDPPSLPLVVGFNPSSMGLSFLVEKSTSSLRLHITWGDYKRERQDDGRSLWTRHPRECVIEHFPIGTVGKLHQICLSPSEAQRFEVTVSGVDDPEIAVEGIAHEVSGQRAVSLFLVNRRTQGELINRNKDERWIYQPRLTVAASNGLPVFLAKDADIDAIAADEAGETTADTLLYRHAREFASGHGVAVSWTLPAANSERALSVFTEFIPVHNVPLVHPPDEATARCVLDMKTLADARNPETLVNYLRPLIQAYDTWVAATKRSSLSHEIHAHKHLKEAAAENLAQCHACVTRLRAGLELLRTDNHAFEAFRFANTVMYDQRIHSLWAEENRRRDRVAGSPRDYDIAENRTWRPFQIAFILLNLVGITRESSEDRRIVDLLWFPTGGGKTEAYLGLAAYTLALRRLTGDRHGMCAGAGVSILMRYTLRLLTVQQFQRAAALVCACEVVRRVDAARWGDEPFRIGIWVGRGTTPNNFAASKAALEDLAHYRMPTEGSPVQLVACPRCGNRLVDDRGVPSRGTYTPDPRTLRTLVWCPNLSCPFSAQRSKQQGLPVVVVDEEIYRLCPSLVVATVDKFARLPFKGETRALFGLIDRYSPTYGYLSEAHGDTVEGRRPRDATPTPRLLPPELIIQDELHLISGPLGTMVGLYETVVDYATRVPTHTSTPVHSKVIASTATIRRAHQQTRQLYAKDLRIFPPPGISARDSFFAREARSSTDATAAAGRLYVGVNAPGSSTKTLLVRVYAILLASAQAEIQTLPPSGDPYGTLVGYFNSLRALGGAKRLVEDDIRTRLRYLSAQCGLAHRSIAEPHELTSRLESWRIPGLLAKLSYPFPRQKTNWPVDVLLATNMISVGVDIDRLGLMVVTGQPKTTAEYIQATSRVGRKYPGLIVTMYNWLGVRDLSHYERFRSYHAALYRHVEPISVTPFSSRALDRGLRGVFAAMIRMAGPKMALEQNATNFDSAGISTRDIVDAICRRAELLVGAQEAKLVRTRLLAHCDDWAHLANELLRYTWLDDHRRPPENSRVLLRTAGSGNEGQWPAPGSLRDVESTAAFYLDDEELR